MSDTKTNRMLVYLDCMYDTLLGAVERVNMSHCKKLYHSEDYHCRLDDRLERIIPEIDMQSINGVFRTRDASLLKISPPSKLLGWILDSCTAQELKKVDEPDSFSMELTINTYPYMLSKVDKKEMRETLIQILGINIVKFVHIELEGLTPKFIKENYDTLVIPDLNKWSNESNMHALPKASMPRVNLVAPLRHLTGEIHEWAQVDVTKMTHYMYSEHLDVDLLPLELFSAVLPED